MGLGVLSALTSITTMLGAILVTLYGQPGKRILAFYLGLSSGMMAFIILLDLLPLAFQQGPVEAVGMGLGLGILTLVMVHHSLMKKQEIVISAHPRQKEYIRLGQLIAVAISIHNIPEGIAIGAGYEFHHHLGLMVALSLALHNIPVGMSIAVPFVFAKVSRWRVLLLTLGVSLCIPLGAWIGHAWFVGSPFLMTMGIAFASGAMGYIVLMEIGPTSMRYHSLSAQLGITLSLAVMYLIHMMR